MENSKMVYTLRQQSPILHFQYDTTGVTLRGSEVKPKLDRFLIKEANGFDAVYDSHPEWFVGYNARGDKNKQKDDISFKCALNYKLRFRNVGKTIVEDPPKYGLYYGNMGEGSMAKYVVGDVEMTILCFYEGLSELIREKISEFFIVTNFGRMSGKGFGSYIVEGFDKISEAQICSALAKAAGSESCYYFNCGKVEDKTKKEIFDYIKVVYSVIKSGYNINGQYTRSMLFEYFHKGIEGVNIGNEKAYVKKMGMTPCNEGTDIPLTAMDRREEGKHIERKVVYGDLSEDEYKYVRLFLGYGERMEFITGFYKDKRDGKWKPNKDKCTISITNKDNAKFRYASPIFFKIINDTVYFVGRREREDVYKTLTAAKFGFAVKGNNTSERTLSAPDYKLFDIDRFMKFFFEIYTDLQRKSEEKERDNRRRDAYAIKPRIKEYKVKG